MKPYTNDQLLDLLKQANHMSDKLIALSWDDLSEAKFNIVFPLGIGLLKAAKTAATVLRKQRTA